MTAWTALPVAALPTDSLIAWAVWELPGGARHLAGFSCSSCEGRATTAVVKFDGQRLRAVTTSGRVYQLEGAPGLNAEAEYVWQRWCDVNDVDPSACVDVSSQLRP